MFASRNPSASKPVPHFDSVYVCRLLLWYTVYLVHGLVAGSLDAQVDHGVCKGAAHVELQGEVVHALEEDDKY